MIYLDNAATTKIDEEVFDTYLKVQRNFFANTTSLHKLGQEANFMLEKSKKDMMKTLGLKNHDCLFVSNATEANNLAILGVTKYKSGNIITSSIEHPSVEAIVDNIKTLDTYKLKTLESGIIDIEDLKANINKDTVLVSIMWVNNIVGMVQPIKEIIEIVKKYPKCKLHVDAVQGICKQVNDFDFNDIDLITFSTHKIYGPKGVGCLLYNKNILIERVIYGSFGQNGLKPGTLDLALCCSTCKAIKKFYPLTKQNYDYIKNLNEYVINNIKNNPAIHIISRYDKSYYNPYIISISIPNIKGETIVHYLEKYDIYVSTGASCSSKLQKREKTIYQMTNNETISLTAIRISFSHTNTISECQKLCECLNEITKEGK